MDMETIKGALFSGFMCKLYAAALAIWMAAEAASYVTRVAHQITKGFTG